MVLVNREFHGKLPEPHYKGFNEALTKLLDTVRERILDFRQLVLILRFVILQLKEQGPAWAWKSGAGFIISLALATP
jgi:hypothetical protein